MLLETRKIFRISINK